MNYFQKMAFEKAEEYEKKVSHLKFVNSNSKRIYGKKYENSLFCASIELKIAWLIFKLSSIKSLFKV